MVQPPPPRAFSSLINAVCGDLGGDGDHSLIPLTSRHERQRNGRCRAALGTRGTDGRRGRVAPAASIEHRLARRASALAQRRLAPQDLVQTSLKGGKSVCEVYLPVSRAFGRATAG